MQFHYDDIDGLPVIKNRVRVPYSQASYSSASLVIVPSLRDPRSLQGESRFEANDVVPVCKNQCLAGAGPTALFFFFSHRNLLNLRHEQYKNLSPERNHHHQKHLLSTFKHSASSNPPRQTTSKLVDYKPETTTLYCRVTAVVLARFSTV